MAKKTDNRIYGAAKDFAGNIIRKGDIIAYGQSFGRCAGMNMAVVLDVYQIEDGVCYDTKLPRYASRVCIYANQDTYKPLHERDPQKLSYGGKSENRKSTLLFSDRCVVLNDNNIPSSPLANHFKAVADAVKTNDTAALKDLNVLC